ncbi:precorrin-3B synthase [Roseobacter cerasinus]|uniref:Precorrin-3B synthase n=1 Tax=Roseobacter cerasinus TaxID=2602289 RepID=A0A640VT03_9RHOB|nr:cobalamin biosynthesis protein CobG [Roseobacter cerasinus]GFE50560.1 precorrin-3B synthase [Roseobacter cerasinus]
MSVAPAVKGWCPGAHRPMMSGDGLIVRVRPYFARLNAVQVQGLCEAAQTYGSGVLDLTNRANLQIRGVSEQGQMPLLQALDDLGLLDLSPELEARRNVLVTPFWQDGDATHRITRDLLSRLVQLPDLPAKFGLAVDAGPAPLLQEDSADIRVERSAQGWCVRADGADRGKPVAEPEIGAAVLDMARWFAAQRTAEERRMRAVVRRVALPAAWREVTPLPGGPRPAPGMHPLGAVVGAEFGQFEAASLARWMVETGAQALRVTPWRRIVLDGAAPERCDDLPTAEIMMRADACAGAPFCTGATVETRALARQLATVTQGSVHVSGCAKGCARRGRADLTLIGRDGRFDLVRQGHAWDAPEKTGLRPDEILAELKTTP